MQQQKDQRKTSRHNDGQSLARSSKVLELPPPVEPCPGGKFHVRVDSLANFADKPGQVAPAYVALRHHTALAVFPTDLKRPLGLNHRRQFAKRQYRRKSGVFIPVTRQKDRQLRKRGRLLPLGLGQPHDDVEPPVAIEHLPRHSATNRDVDALDHVGGIEPVTCQHSELGPHGQFRHAGRLLHFHVNRAGNAAHHGGDFLRGAPEFAGVFAEHLHRKIAPHAGDEFLKSHLDRLGEFVFVADQVAHGFAHI